MFLSYDEVRVCYVSCSIHINAADSIREKSRKHLNVFETRITSSKNPRIQRASAKLESGPKVLPRRDSVSS
ncbi:hypothetical protein CHARACLAT_020192 [Characodon lateralis]|uniref:Uncharacterized protein n=1 Tax=Characodon lateralis TaxID=208331 RepID=A0ABU7EKQ8_9TELE|nr:hypothetical protein [Characodon lateralis]